MSYEGQTYEVILARMMNRIKTEYPNLDDREGSIIFNALAPAAAELAIAYIQLDNVRNESFVNTATREYILIGCEQMGIDTTQFGASAGTFKGEFNVEVEINSRWNCELFNYIVTEYIGKNASGYYEYKMLCETTGTEPNNLTGTLTPITNAPSGLSHCELTECLIEGENENTDEEIRDTYYEYVNSAVADGNVAQYRRWCNEYDGIGNFKIVPLWNGSNTVKVSILSSSNKAATDALVNEVQNYFDPTAIETFNGNGATKTFTLQISPKPETLDMVRVGGTVKTKGTDYTYQSSTGVVSFTSPPTSGTKNIEVRYNGGMGNGVAPIGAFVTVDTASELPINISATISLKSGYSDTDGINDALGEFFSAIAYEKSQVSYMTIGATILSVEGVEFVTNLTVNGGTSDINLGTYQIPVLGTTNWTVSS